MTIEERLLRLERENRCLKGLGLLALTSIAAVFLLGQTYQADFITARGFHLTDRYGRTVASLTTTHPQGDSFDYPSLLLWNPQDPNRMGAWIGYREGYPGLRFFGEAGTANLDLGPHHLMATDENGAVRALLALMVDGEPRFILNDPQQETVFSAP